MMRKCTASLGVCSFLHRQRIAPKAIGDVDEIIVIDAARLLDDGERARVLERRLNDERRDLARRVFVFVGRDRRGFRRAGAQK